MKTTFTATGDSFTTRRIPSQYPGGEELRNFIAGHDVKFNNLEMTYHEQEGYPAAFSGGTWAMADPVILDDILEYGFNIFNTANNHSCDYSHGGLLSTIRNLKKRNMLFAGTGENLCAATKAAYLDVDHCRVALIGVTSDFHDSDIAGEQGIVLSGRPGVNGLRTETIYHVTRDYFNMLKKLVDDTNMNAMENYGVSLGYYTAIPEGYLNMNGLWFYCDDKACTETKPKETDMKRVTDEIKEAKCQADYVMVSIHTHNGNNRDFNQPPQFMEIFAHECINAGADAILGHGPHELRGIEIYKGKPVFYSLGNFIFQTETVAVQPVEAFINKGFPIATKVGEYMNARSKNGTRGYGILKPIWFSAIPSWEMQDGKVSEIRLYPISLGMEMSRGQKGLPRLAKDEGILHHLQELSNAYGTKIEIENNIGVIRIS